MKLRRQAVGWGLGNIPSGKGPSSQCRRCKRCGSIPGLRRSSGGGNGNPCQYSWLENSMDRGAWQAMAYEVAKIWTQLSDWAQTHTQIHTHTDTHTHTHTQSKERGGVWGFRAGNSSWGGSRGGEMLARQKCPMCRQAAQVKKLPLGTRPFSNLIYCLDFPYKREFLLCFQSFSCVCTFLKLASLKSLWV